MENLRDSVEVLRGTVVTFGRTILIVAPIGIITTLLWFWQLIPKGLWSWTMIILGGALVICLLSGIAFAVYVLFGLSEAQRSRRGNGVC